MALDTKQKRGSAINMAQPWRIWLAEPDGTLDANDRISLLKLCSAIAPSAGVAIDVELDLGNVLFPKNFDRPARFPKNVDLGVTMFPKNFDRPERFA